MCGGRESPSRRLNQSYSVLTRRSLRHRPMVSFLHRLRQMRFNLPRPPRSTGITYSTRYLPAAHFPLCSPYSPCSPKISSSIGQRQTRRSCQATLHSRGMRVDLICTELLLSSTSRVPTRTSARWRKEQWDSRWPIPVTAHRSALAAGKAPHRSTLHQAQKVRTRGQWRRTLSTMR